MQTGSYQVLAAGTLPCIALLTLLPYDSLKSYCANTKLTLFISFMDMLIESKAVK